MEPGKQSAGSKSAWEDLLAKIRPGRSGNEPAVHKPLLVLMILAQAHEGGPNRFALEDLAPQFDALIQRFGAAAQPGGSEMPFWHLKSDGFWVVEDEDALPRRSQGDRPTKTGLLEHRAQGHVRPELWAQLAGNLHLIEKLAVQVLETHWPRSEHKALLKHLGLELSAEARARAGMLRQAGGGA